MSSMKLLDKLFARRRHKTHERYLAERARQRELSGQDAQQAVRDLAHNSAAQNSTFGVGQ
jgi:hypothetical protein